MVSLLPIIAAVLQAASLTLDKAILSARRINFLSYTSLSFPLSFAISTLLFFILQPHISLELFAGRLGFLIICSALITIVSNLIFYRALDDDYLGEIQTIQLMEAIPIIIFSSIFFQDERNYIVLSLALIASLALIWSHWGHHQFRMAKNTKPFFIWALIGAPLGAFISKILLETWDPVALEMVRSGIVALALLPFAVDHIGRIRRRVAPFLILTNILTSVAWILFYYSYKYSGIVYTLLLFSLQPLLVYFAAVAFLKEKFDRRKFSAFIIILACIGVAEIVIQ